MTAGGLWRGHPCTRTRSTQADVLLDMLRNARQIGVAVELPEIMEVGIAQHGARFNEIRSRGFIVENQLSRNSAGIVRSRYWLRFDPEKDGIGAR